jgi:hypothetical protein
MISMKMSILFILNYCVYVFITQEIKHSEQLEK